MVDRLTLSGRGPDSPDRRRWSEAARLQRAMLDLRLRYQHPIKRVPVTKWQPTVANRVVQVHRQDRELVSH